MRILNHKRNLALITQAQQPHEKSEKVVASLYLCHVTSAKEGQSIEVMIITQRSRPLPVIFTGTRTSGAWHAGPDEHNTPLCDPPENLVLNSFVQDIMRRKQANINSERRHAVFVERRSETGTASKYFKAEAMRFVLAVKDVGQLL